MKPKYTFTPRHDAGPDGDRGPGEAIEAVSFIGRISAVYRRNNGEVVIP